MRKDLKWFKDRVGKRVYRMTNTCKCEVCLRVFEQGLIIQDELHATYLYDIQNEVGHQYEDLPKQNQQI